MAQARIFYQQDCDLNKLSGKTVAIIGYGSQGHAHALNLKDSGVDVIVGLYEGSKSWAKAEKAGLKVMTSAEAAKNADIIMILINDEKQAKLYKESIEPYMTEGMESLLQRLSNAKRRLKRLKVTITTSTVKHPSRIISASQSTSSRWSIPTSV